MASEDSAERRVFREALGPESGCLSVENLELCLPAEGVPAELSRHLEACAYCRAELDLLRAFHTPARDPEEGEAIRRITERLQSPRALHPAAPRSWWQSLARVRWLASAGAALAAMLIVTAIGLQWRHSAAPRLGAPDLPAENAMRSGRLTLLAPAGDVQSVPKRIEWQPVTGAVQYRVQLLEVDHAELWNAATAETRLDFPARVQALIVPAKTLLLQVTAFDSGGVRVSESEFVRFRVLRNIYTR